MSAVFGLKVTIKDGVAVLSGINGITKITFLGASCTSSVKPGECSLDCVTLLPLKNVDAVVALTTIYGSNSKGSSSVHSGGLVKLVWRDEKLFIDMDDVFMSPTDRLGQVVEQSGDIFVTTNGQMFGTCRDQWGSYDLRSWTNKKDAYVKKGIRIVDDASLICRYLAGQATLAELEAAASGDLRTAEYVRYIKLQTDFCEALEKYGKLQDEHLALQERFLTFQDGLAKVEKESSRGALLLREIYANVRIENDRLQGENLNLRNELASKFGARVKKFFGDLRDKCRNAFREPNNGGVM